MLKAMFTPTSEHGISVVFDVPPNGEINLPVGTVREVTTRDENGRVVHFSLPHFGPAQSVTIRDGGWILGFPVETEITLYQLLYKNKEGGKAVTATPTETRWVSTGGGYRLNHGQALSAEFSGGTLGVSWL